MIKKISLEEVINLTTAKKCRWLNFLIYGAGTWRIASWSPDIGMFEFGYGRYEGDVLEQEKVDEIYELPHSSEVN